MILRILALLLLAMPAYAADGDRFATTYVDNRKVVQVFLLCDSDTAPATCSEFNVSRFGFPDEIRVTLETETACSGTPTVVLRGFNASGATDKFDLLTIPTSDTPPQKDVTIQYQGHPFIDATVTDLTDCSPGIDVIVSLHYGNTAR